MQKALLLKILIIAALMLLIGLPLTMIESTIRERMAFRDQAVASIAADSVREQTLVGPVLVLPYTEEYDETVLVGDEHAKKGEVLHRSVPRQLLVYPNELQVSGNIVTDRRYRGIHQVLVYSGQYALAGDFILPAKADLPHEVARSRLVPGAAYVSLGIDDVRGIHKTPKIVWGGETVEFQQGARLAAFKSGLHAPLGVPELAEAGQVKFSFDLGLDGIERQHFVPVGKNNKFALASNWPHPQFGGRFLPSTGDRIINAQGFSAAWSISSLATDAQQQISHMAEGSVPAKDAAATGGAELDRFSVGFIEPINVYSMADRATKYGLLFVTLTFAAFFMLEMIKRLPIHPIQYALVGLALVLFFLLLVSLSEHIAFVQAYLIASVACIGLIGYYLTHVLRDWRRGLGFGAGLTALYGALYSLLISENNALVMGSLLLFAVLGAIMVATRKVDWYQLGKVEAQA